MVKGGTKRKIPIEKITKKNSLATCFTKRSYGLYSKASQLCLLSGAQIAVLATPSSSQSNVSFYSFGHSSVDAVVSAYLAGESPVPIPAETKQTREDIGICLARKDLGLGFWWDDDRLNISENLEEIKEAIESMSSVLRDARRLRSEVAVNINQRDLKNNDKKKKKSDVVLHQGTDQTLNLQSASAICCVPECLQNTDTEISENFCLTDNNNIRTQELDQTLNLQTNCGIPDDCLKTDTEIVVLDDDLHLPAGNLDDEEMDLDQLIDFETGFECTFSDQQLKDFETNFEGLFSDQELDEFASSLLS